jgi:hypothetical protein
VTGSAEVEAALNLELSYISIKDPWVGRAAGLGRALLDLSIGGGVDGQLLSQLCVSPWLFSTN